MDVQRMNNAAITLAILPADIVRILLQIMGLPIESLRLVRFAVTVLVFKGGVS